MFFTNTRLRPTAWIGSILLCVVTIGSGCHRDTAADKPRTYPVTGTVTYQGKPVEGAIVTFIGEKHSATGKTNSEGRFQMTTFRANDGVVPGEYRVIISKFAAGPLQDDETNEPSGDEPTQPVLRSEIPDKYANPETSLLRAKVLPQANEIDFDLK